MSKHDKRKEKNEWCIHRLVMEKVFEGLPGGALEIISTGSTAGTELQAHRPLCANWIVN